MTVDDYIESQSKDWIKQLLQILREATLEVAPGMKESVKYKIPFYSRYHHILFLNVPAKKEVVQVGFYWGALLSKELDFMESKELKQIRHISFKSIEHFEDSYENFNLALLASLEIDEKIAEYKKNKISIIKVLKGQVN